MQDAINAVAKGIKDCAARGCSPEGYKALADGLQSLAYAQDMVDSREKAHQTQPSAPGTPNTTPADPTGQAS